MVRLGGVFLPPGLVSVEVRCHTRSATTLSSSSTSKDIIRGIQGEIYPCKADIFEDTYELVEASIHWVSVGGKE